MAEAGPPSGPRARGPGATREGAQAGRRQKRSAPIGRGKRQEPPGPDPPRRGPQRAARQGRRPQGPGPPQRDPPGEPRGRADGRRRPADRPSGPGAGGSAGSPAQAPRHERETPPAEGTRAAGQRAEGPGHRPGAQPEAEAGRRVEPVAAQRSRGWPRPSTPQKSRRSYGRRDNWAGWPPEWGRAPAQLHEGCGGRNPHRLRLWRSWRRSRREASAASRPLGRFGRASGGVLRHPP